MADPPACSALEAELRALVRAGGPLPVGRYMELCLDHAGYGYYRTAEAFGPTGDFVTAPEVSQMFGEILGLLLAQAWLDRGAPRPVRLLELGPGRGTLMADLLRSAGSVPGFEPALDVHLVERSPRLMALQQRTLGDRARWHHHPDDVPEGFTFLVANEFLDALPVDQLIRRDGRWWERRVGLEDDRLAFVATAPAPQALAACAPAEAEDGAITEVSPARAKLVRRFAERLMAHGGLALLIDYGGTPHGPTGDTLQAVRAHRPLDPLAAPGEADLSTQVDFGALRDAAEAAGAAVYGPVFQGTFLRTLGIDVRAARLMDDASAATRHGIRSGLHRLTDPSMMGEAFKVLVIGRPDEPPPPGFVRHD